jgi:hypothetical protein
MTIADEHPTRHGSWWTTLPGILTALAAVITATGGLIAILLQAGFFDKTEQPVARAAEAGPSKTDTERDRTGRGGSGEASTASNRLAADVLIGDLRAKRFDGMVITHRDRTVVAVQPAFPQGPFTLTNGQSVGLDRIKTVEPQHDPFSGRVRFTLVNGQQFEGQVTGLSQYIWGANDLGAYKGELTNIQRIDFLRPDE